MEPAASDAVKKSAWKREHVRKRIALEWLYFLGCVAIGLTILPATMMFAFGHAIRFGLFYEAVVKGEGFARLVLFAPYIVFQLGRSILWSFSVATHR
jgi:hypothetical protein